MPRKATGLKRPYPVPVNLNQDEDELLGREAHFQGTSKTELLRRAYFDNPVNGADRLTVLRASQKDLPISKFRRPAK